MLHGQHFKGVLDFAGLFSPAATHRPGNGHPFARPPVRRSSRRRHKKVFIQVLRPFGGCLTGFCLIYCYSVAADAAPESTGLAANLRSSFAVLKRLKSTRPTPKRSKANWAKVVSQVGNSPKKPF